MMQRMNDLFRRDFWMKILALALAILLWTMVVRDYNKETTVVLDAVPLEVRQHPTFEVFEGRRDMETSVDISVTGPSLLVNGLSKNEIRAWVDYSRIAEAGRPQEVEVQVEGPARIRDQVKYRATPATVPVTLVNMRTLPVPLVVSPVTGIIEQDGREYRFTAAPESKTREITGREDALNQVRSGLMRLTEIDLVPPVANGALREKSVRLSKVIEPLDAAGKLVDKLPQHYADVVVTWEELPPGKVVQVEPRTGGSLPAGFELVGLTVEPSTLTLRSTTLHGQLPDISVVETEPVDLTGQTKTFTVPARVIAPAGTNAVVASVNVTVVIAETRIEKIFGAVPLEVRGQEATIEVSLQVPTVQVRLTGPYTLMQPMDAGVVKVFVELAGLTEGTHKVPVKMDPIPGVTEVAIDPAIVEVLITNR
ncbi:MAG: YbbR-like domain-containing protein [Bacillota bacterium]